MKSYQVFFKNYWAVIILVFLFAIMVQGCTTPLVKVDNQTVIGECSEGAGDEDGVGACFSKPYSDSATNFWHKELDHVIQASEGLTCSSGSAKCRRTGSASNCFDAAGQANYCYNTYTTAGSGSCYCACGQD